MLPDALTDGPDFERLMIDTSYIKAHSHSTRPRRGGQTIARTKGG